MRILKFILLFICTVFSMSIFGQSKRSPAPPTIKNNYGCEKKHDYLPKDRLKNYPFDHAKNILIVSFDYQEEDTSSYIINGRDTIKSYSNGRIPIKNKTLNNQFIKEKFTLNPSQVDSLTDILFNYDYREKTTIATSSECFDPHHAIVFTNKEGKIIEYIEICFLCSNIYSSSAKINPGNFCEGKYNLLKKLFRKIGVKVNLSNK